MSVSSQSSGSLVEQNRSYAEAVVGRLMKSLRIPSALRDELVGAAYLGLVESAGRYNGNLGVEFKSFAFLRIRGAIIDALRANSYFSGKAYRYVKVLQGMQDYQHIMGAAECSGAKNAADELAEIMDFAASGAVAFQLSLDEQGPEMTELQTSVKNPEQELEDRQTIQILREILATLDEKERTVIEEYYFNDKNFVEIAEAQEGSKSWVSRLHLRAISTVKKRLLERVATRGCASPVRLPRDDSPRPKRGRRKSGTDPLSATPIGGKKKGTTRRKLERDSSL